MFSKFKFSKPKEPKELKEPKQKSSHIPQLQEYINQRDYTGAITILENREDCRSDLQVLSWVGFCLFHSGDFESAAKVYKTILDSNPKFKNGWINLACCYYRLEMFDECNQAIKKSDKSELKQRIQFHLAYSDGMGSIKEASAKLGTSIPNQMSLASRCYTEGRYQEAIDMYKKILEANNEFIALNVYIALCYYKMDYQDVSQERLALYLQQFPQSALTINLNAANRFKMYGVFDPSDAELADLQELISEYQSQTLDIIRHNMVVFKNGENGLKVLPGLIDSLSEAKINLAICYLKNGNISSAAQLVKHINGKSSTEFVLKAVVDSFLGQENNSSEQIKSANTNFLSVGNSATDCDTILGRQCMSSAYFLMKQFSDVIVYLNSIKTYFSHDDTFNFNFGQAKGMVGEFSEAEEALKNVQDNKIKSSFIYKLWLAYIYINNNSATLAWEIYLKMEATDESLTLLQLIANESHRLGIYYYAAKAFHLLERMNSNDEHWEGKKSSCLGLFHMVVTKNQPVELLRDVEEILHESLNPEAEYICRIIKKWRKEN